MTSKFVTLENGLIVPVPALEAADRLREQGFTLEAKDGVLRVGRTDGQRVADVLTADDQATIRRWKWHLLALA